jgi:hypothetical protein
MSKFLKSARLVARSFIKDFINSSLYKTVINSAFIKNLIKLYNQLQTYLLEPANSPRSQILKELLKFFLVGCTICVFLLSLPIILTVLYLILSGFEYIIQACSQEVLCKVLFCVPRLALVWL